MFGIIDRIWLKNRFSKPYVKKFLLFIAFLRNKFPEKLQIFSTFLKKNRKFFPKIFARQSIIWFCKKKRAAFGGELVVVGEGGGRWGMVSKGRGYEFDVCARLENSATTPSSIFLKFFPKNPKSDDCTWVFYCLK